MKKYFLAGAITAICFVQPATAGDMAVGVKVGTLGVGAELTTNVVPMFINARVLLSGLNYDQTINDTSVTYDAKLKLFSLGAMADVYPFAGKFRLTGGLFYNGNKLTMVGVPAAASYTFNGTTYVAGAGSSVTATVDFNKVAPYVGIGFGDPVSSGSPIGINVDLGVLYQGQAKTSLTTVGIPGVAAADIAAEKQKLDDALNNMKFYPVASIGVTFRF